MYFQTPRDGIRILFVFTNECISGHPCCPAPSFAHESPMRDLLLKHRIATGASWTGQRALYGGTSTPAIYLSPSPPPRVLLFPLSLFFSRLRPASPPASPSPFSLIPVNLDPGNSAAEEGRARAREPRQKKGAKGRKDAGEDG